ncbi:MAG: MFS transporter [Clostridia bacterium]|nr:MFS transporter [Clostridia bacterium]
MKNNKIYTIIAYSLYVVASLSASGSLLQTLLNALGFSSGEIYIHSSIIQAVTVITILLGSRFADGKSIIRRTAISCFLSGILFVGYLPLCFMREASTVSFVLLIAVSSLQALTIALHTVCDYKLPYFLFSVTDYGVVLAVCGVISSIVSFIVGLVVSTLSDMLDYVSLMIFVFIISGVFYVISGVFRSFTRPLYNLDALSAERENQHIGTTLSHPAFRSLFIPHLLRGYGYGVSTVLAVVATELGYSTSVATATVSVMAVATILSCTVFGIFSRKPRARTFIALGSLSYIVLPLLLIKGSPTVFLSTYAIVIFGRNFIDNAVPAALVSIVPPKIAGPYNALRMAIHFSGVVISNLLATAISTELLILSALAAQLLSGMLYVVGIKRVERLPM